MKQLVNKTDYKSKLFKYERELGGKIILIQNSI